MVLDVIQSYLNRLVVEACVLFLLGEHQLLFELIYGRRLTLAFWIQTPRLILHYGVLWLKLISFCVDALAAIG